MKLARTMPGTARSMRDVFSILERLFRDFTGGIQIRLWDGQTVALGEHPPSFTLIFRDPGKFRELVLHRDPLRLADAHFDGHVEIEGSIYDVLCLRDHFQSLKLSASEKATLIAKILSIPRSPSKGLGMSADPRTWRARTFKRHTRKTDRHAIAFHYDVSNEFYKLWLDEQMVYSCAYFEDADDSLDQAQCQKLDYLCRKLRLKPGERLLDIGCGWGGLVCWAAKRYGVTAMGITLSRNQLEHAQRRIAAEGLGDRVKVELKDYRDLGPDTLFDKVVSVGMFEHVGIKNLPVYFAAAHRVLKPGGLFLNHGITTEHREGKGGTVDTRFINRYVFPDGELESIGNVVRGMEKSGFEILDVEGLRRHYALTLRHWVNRLEQRRQEALQYVGEATFRIWRMYMAGCALHFESGGMGLYQILGARRGEEPRIPLTRDDLYVPVSKTIGNAA